MNMLWGDDVKWIQGKRRHSELLTPKINISAESLFKVLISAAKDDKRVDCQGV